MSKGNLSRSSAEINRKSIPSQSMERYVEEAFPCRCQKSSATLLTCSVKTSMVSLMLNSFIQRFGDLTTKLDSSLASDTYRSRYVELSLTQVISNISSFGRACLRNFARLGFGST